MSLRTLHKIITIIYHDVHIHVHVPCACACGSAYHTRDSVYDDGVCDTHDGGGGDHSDDHHRDTLQKGSLLTKKSDLMLHM